MFRVCGVGGPPALFQCNIAQTDFESIGPVGSMNPRHALSSLVKQSIPVVVNMVSGAWVRSGFNSQLALRRQRKRLSVETSLAPGKHFTPGGTPQRWLLALRCPMMWAHELTPMSKSFHMHLDIGFALVVHPMSGRSTRILDLHWWIT